MVAARNNWLQLNVALRRRGGSASASVRGLFDTVERLLTSWTFRRSVDCFFFMRKPPDVRLRFRATSGHHRASVERSLALAAATLVGQKHARWTFFSQYEPEVFRFGGIEAMELVHQHFFVDSLEWVALHRANAETERQLDDETLALAVLNDLFARTLDDHAEVWDAWSAFASSLGVQAPATATSAVVIDLDGLLPHGSAMEARVLRRYRRQNQALAKGLQSVWRAGRLQCGLRLLLLHLAMFHFHRHGIAGPRQAVLTQRMAGAWNPNRLIGEGRS